VFFPEVISNILNFADNISKGGRVRVGEGGGG
jgi:hypothetical protein